MRLLVVVYGDRSSATGSEAGDDAAGSVSPAGTQFVFGAFGRLAFQRRGPIGDVPLLLCHRFRGTIDDWDPAFLNVL
jgi:hypothetical protein